MPIDPNIALGVKPMQFESPINQMAKMYELQNAQQSNQLNQMKMDEYQRSVANTQRRNALLGTFTPDMTVDQQVNALAKGGFLDEAKSLAESTAKVNADKRATRTSELDALTKTHAIVKSRLSGVIGNSTLTNLISTLDKIEKETGEDMSDDKAEAMAIGDNPDAIRKWATYHSLEADKLLEPHFINQENVMVNGVPTTRVIQMPKYGTGSAITVAGTEGATYNKPAASTTVNVSANTSKKYGEVFATKVAEADSAMHDAALTAPKIAANANDILNIINTGKFYSGTGADIKLGLAKFLNMAGKDDAEKIINTQNLIKGQGQATLSAIKSSGLGTSQGFTDKDLDFLKGITGGSIALNAENIRHFAEVQHKAAAELQKKWVARRNTIPKDALEGTGIDQESYDLPPMVQPPKGKGKNTPINTKTGATTSNW